MMKIIGKIALYLAVFIFVSLLIWLGYLLLGGRDAAILMYHSIGEPGLSKTETINVSEEAFQRQMKFLRDHHCHVISLLELADLLEHKKKIPPRTVVITFDDGYENNYTKAFPVLKKYGFPATIFVIADFLGQEQRIYKHPHVFKFMSVAMVREMSGSGLITIGSHTKSHIYLPDIKDSALLRDEIEGSRRVLEKILGKPVGVFCYPKGGYTPEIERLVRQAGYKAAVTTFPHHGFAGSDIYALKRIKITESSKDLSIFFIETSGYYMRMKEMSK